MAVSRVWCNDTLLPALFHPTDAKGAFCGRTSPANQAIRPVAATQSYSPRPQLIAKLNAGLNHRLILVSATAGFGETTLVADWLSQVERPAAWVPLDEEDNDLHRFFAYAAATVRQVEGVGNSMQKLLQAP